MEPATAFGAIEPALCCRRPFARWFAGRGWAPRAHQLELLAKAQAGRSVLLIAPTGGGKTLAGFLPTLVELSERAARGKRLVSTGREVRRNQGLHTLYISPLKALAVDIARNLEMPVARDGAAGAARDPHRRHAGLEAPAPAPRSARHPADHAGATGAAAGLRRCALSVRLAAAAWCSTNCIRWSPPSAAICCRSAWRGCFALAPQLTTVGLSATVAEPDELCRFLVPQPSTAKRAPIW